MKKVLILGSSGFIGKNIFEYFKKENFFLYGTYLKNKPKKNSRIKLKITENIGKSVVTIPSHPNIKENDVDKIIKLINSSDSDLF